LLTGYADTDAATRSINKAKIDLLHMVYLNHDKS